MTEKDAIMNDLKGKTVLVTGAPRGISGICAGPPPRWGPSCCCIMPRVVRRRRNYETR